MLVNHVLFVELVFTKELIEINKELNSLDEFVIEFTSVLNKLNINYVVISGYVSILFGRSRSSEDIDLILEKLDFEKFSILWKALADFDCIITSDVKNAYNEYLIDGQAIRFAKKDTFIPNIELKFPKTDLDSWVLANKKEVLLNKKQIYISQIELQIPFKLFLGSEKDIEDAKYLYDLFKDKLDLPLLNEFNRKLNIIGLFDKYLR